MASFRLRQRADADLISIWHWTHDKWSPSQADEYIDSLTAMMAMLADDPTRGRAADTVSPGLYRMNCQAHVIFYRRVSEGVEIVRVLHGRMNLPRHLKDE